MEQIPWFQILTPLLALFVAVHKTFDLSVPQFPLVLN